MRDCSRIPSNCVVRVRCGPSPHSLHASDPLFPPPTPPFSRFAAAAGARFGGNLHGDLKDVDRAGRVEPDVEAGAGAVHQLPRPPARVRGGGGAGGSRLEAEPQPLHAAVPPGGRGGRERERPQAPRRGGRLPRRNAHHFIIGPIVGRGRRLYPPRLCRVWCALLWGCLLFAFDGRVGGGLPLCERWGGGLFVSSLEFVIFLIVII